MERERVPFWAIWVMVIAISANAFGSIATKMTIGLMHTVSDFALRVRANDERYVPYYNLFAFPLITALAIAYLWPLVAHFRKGTPRPAPLRVQQRAINGPLAIALLSFAPWLISLAFFPALTLWKFGHWSTDLMSQHVLGPLVNGFLAAAVTYFALEWRVRVRVMPNVFPAGVGTVPGAFPVGVRGRLLVFLLAIAFTPLFTMLGLVRATAERLASGMAADAVVPTLARASEVTFAVYLALGVGLTLLLARLLTRPLEEVAAALRRIGTGDLDVQLPVRSRDEVGVLQDGVNSMVSALRDKERIMQTFGRVVDPSVRDRLLEGHIRLGGELRHASILLCDLRGFTTFAEQTAPDVVVDTLNEFFTEMTAWVRECGGFVDKFIGDAMLVVFGLFEPDGTKPGAGAADAMRCAVGIGERLVLLNRKRAAGKQPLLAVSGGIHSGEVLAGTIGAADRHEYTVIGDTVNVAARLQELCKERGCTFLASAGAYQMARSRGFSGAASTPETVTLRGRSEPIAIVRLA